MVMVIIMAIFCITLLYLISELVSVFIFLIIYSYHYHHVPF